MLSSLIFFILSELTFSFGDRGLENPPKNTFKGPILNFYENCVTVSPAIFVILININTLFWEVWPMLELDLPNLLNWYKKIRAYAISKTDILVMKQFPRLNIYYLSLVGLFVWSLISATTSIFLFTKNKKDDVHQQWIKKIKIIIIDHFK